MRLLLLTTAFAALAVPPQVTAAPVPRKARAVDTSHQNTRDRGDGGRRIFFLGREQNVK